jgi:GDSL-like Lipase/Acylhydrolase family
MRWFLFVLCLVCRVSAQVVCKQPPVKSDIPAFVQCVQASQPGYAPGHPFWDGLGTPSVVKIMVIGGSETAGVDCRDDDGHTFKDCAWSARLGKKLSSMFPGKRIVVQNIASGGTTVSVALPMLGTWLLTQPDLLLVDFIINDSWEAQRAGSNLMSLYEALIRKCHSLGFFNLAFVNTCSAERCSKARSTISTAAAAHDVVVFDFAGVARCSETEGDASPEMFWDTTGAHPSWVVHERISTMIALKFSHQMRCEQNGSQYFTSEDALAALDFCTAPATLYSAFAPPASGVSTGGWVLVEDRPGKPGWITTSNNATINFEIVFGSSAQLSVAWLRSYEGLGDAQMTLNGRTVRLPGLYGPDEAGGRISQTFLLTFSAYHSVFQPELGLSGLLGFNVLPKSRHTLTFSTSPELAQENISKFKIVSISTC